MVEEIAVTPGTDEPGTVEEMVVTNPLTSSPNVPSLLTTRAGCNIVKTESPPPFETGTGIDDAPPPPSSFFSTVLPSNSAIKAL